MKKLLLPIAALFALAAPVAVSAQEYSAEELKLIETIRDERSLPQRVEKNIYGFLEAFGNHGDNFVDYNMSRFETQMVQAGALNARMGYLYENKVAGVVLSTSRYFFFSLVPGTEQYVTPIEGDNKMFANKFSSNEIQNVPGELRMLPEYLGKAYMGEVDFGHLLLVEREDMLDRAAIAQMMPSLTAEQRANVQKQLDEGAWKYTVYWQGRFIEQTPLSPGAWEYYPDVVFISTWEQVNAEWVNMFRTSSKKLSDLEPELREKLTAAMVGKGIAYSAAE
jgi:hypothetical protein